MKLVQSKECAKRTFVEWAKSPRKLTRTLVGKFLALFSTKQWILFGKNEPVISLSFIPIFDAWNYCRKNLAKISIFHRLQHSYDAERAWMPTKQREMTRTLQYFSRQSGYPLWKRVEDWECRHDIREDIINHKSRNLDSGIAYLSILLFIDVNLK